jgi:WD40 repeat protein
MSQKVKLLSGIATAGILAALLLGLNWLRLHLNPSNPNLVPETGQVSPIFDLAVSRDGQTAFSSHTDGVIRVWNLGTSDLRSELSGHNGRVNSLALATSETFLVSGGGDGTIRIWNVATEREINVNLPLGAQQRILSIDLSADDQYLAAGTESGRIYIWETNTWNQIGSFSAGLDGGSHPVEALAFDPTDSNILASGSDGGSVQLWKIGTDGSIQNVGRFPNAEQRILSVAISPDGTRLATGTYEGDIVLWNLATGQVAQNLDFNGHNFIVSSLNFITVDNTVFLVSSSYDETVKIWDLSAGYARDTITDHNGFVYTAILTPDGQSVISGGLDGRLHQETLDLSANQPGN